MYVFIGIEFVGITVLQINIDHRDKIAVNEKKNVAYFKYIFEFLQSCIISGIFLAYLY